MNSISRDPWQEAADTAAGHEGPLVKHNCKTAAVTIDGARADPDMKLCFLMSTACHGRIKFDGDRVVERNVIRYADAAPDRRFLPTEEGQKLTSVLAVGVSDSGLTGLMTYSGASGSVRTAFETQLLRPYVRLKRRAFPVVTLGFKGLQDEYGNSKPSFTIVAWRAIADFAALLGEEAEAPQLSAPEHPAARLDYMRPSAPEADDVFAGVDPDDLIR
jgi:hypothetical protein